MSDLLIQIDCRDEWLDQLLPHLRTAARDEQDRWKKLQQLRECAASGDVQAQAKLTRIEELLRKGRERLKAAAADASETL
jgi:RNA polymerase-interacting CarD/CdnL/TRCF family regulator